MKSLLTDLALFIFLSVLASCALLDAAPAPLPRRERPAADRWRLSILEYHGADWAVVFAADGSYRATRKLCRPWAGTWRWVIAGEVIEVVESPEGGPENGTATWRARVRGRVVVAPPGHGGGR